MPYTRAQRSQMKLLRVRYLILGLAGVSVLLAACSSGAGEKEQPQATATPTPTAVRAVAPTATATAARTPTAPPLAATPTPTATAGKTPTSVVQTPSSSASGQEIQVLMRNNVFPEEIHVKAGTKVVFVVINESDNDEHSFEFPDFGLTYKVQAGETIRIEWQAPNSKGVWDAGCFLTQPGGVHDGMEGLLIIE
ncbi:MAG: cupredoxin domain-containing protein [Chloroflexi bacterium]|nr:cupredoxin domain-containing protein [Chloroflexota bacterium]